MGEIIKNPQQARSLQTKQKILDAGKKMIQQKGYYNVTTPDIAKAAGVSTGILYRYYKNKLAIVLEIMDQIVAEIIHPMLEGLTQSVLKQENFIKFLEQVADDLCDLHEELGQLHNDLATLLNSENEIQNYYYFLEEDIVKNLEQLLKDNGIYFENMSEKIHIAFNLLEDYAHEKVFHSHDYIDYDILKKEIIGTLAFVVFR